MKQKKIGDILYVFDTTPYEITEGTDASIIYVPDDSLYEFIEDNLSLVSKIEPYYYKALHATELEWEKYVDNYTITVIPTSNGTCTVDKTDADPGEEITLTQSASTGYEFTSWDVKDADNNSVTVTNNKFAMPASNVTVNAVFDKIDFDITIDNTIQNGTLSAPATANLGDTVTITATPSAGYKLDTLTVMCGSLEVTVVNSQFTMPAGDVTITGTFIQDVIPYEQQYFTIESEADNNSITINLPESNHNTFSYSLDNGANWTAASSDGSNYTYSASLNEGDKILIKSTNTTFNITEDDSLIYSEGEFIVYGNIMSLLYGDNFANQTSFPAGSSRNFYQLFYYAGKLTDASNLILPATTLTESCYSYMFQYCTSLTTAPELPATTLVESCYANMFSGCSSLNYIKCLATDVYSNCTYSWVNGVAASGTFIKAATTSGWNTGEDGIPSGWTVEDYVVS